MIVTDINIDVNVTWYNDFAVFKEFTTKQFTCNWEDFFRTFLSNFCDKTNVAKVVAIITENLNP